MAYNSTSNEDLVGFYVALTKDLERPELAWFTREILKERQLIVDILRDRGHILDDKDEHALYLKGRDAVDEMNRVDKSTEDQLGIDCQG